MELMNSSYFKNFKKNSWYELEYYGKFNFHKIEFQKSNRLLKISQTVVDSYIFSLTVVYGHFGRQSKPTSKNSNNIIPQRIIYGYSYSNLSNNFTYCKKLSKKI